MQTLNIDPSICKSYYKTSFFRTLDYDGWVERHQAWGPNTTRNRDPDHKCTYGRR